MAETMDHDLDSKIDDKDAYVYTAYERAIGYYRKRADQTSSTMIAAFLTVITGLSQNFQWGSA